MTNNYNITRLSGFYWYYATKHVDAWLANPNSPHPNITLWTKIGIDSPGFSQKTYYVWLAYINSSDLIKLCTTHIQNFIQSDRFFDFLCSNVEFSPNKPALKLEHITEQILEQLVDSNFNVGGYIYSLLYSDTVSSYSYQLFIDWVKFLNNSNLTEMVYSDPIPYLSNLNSYLNRSNF